jgi:hypothetical protein
MHAAQITRSERLQRVDRLLADGLPHSTREIIQIAHVCAVNSIVAELRENGRDIGCQRVEDEWFYQLDTPA